MDNIGQDPCLLPINGPPNSGKSHLIDWIAYNMFKKGFVNTAIVWCPTHFEGSYSWVADSNFVKTTWSEDWFYKAVLEKIEEDPSIKPLLIWDDWEGSVKFTTRKMKRFFTTYRKYNARCLFAVQYPNMVPPIFRVCVSGSIILETYSKKALVTMYNDYGSKFPDFKTFEKYCKQNVKDFNFLLWSKRGLEGNKHKFLGLYRAPEKNAVFSFGAPRLTGKKRRRSEDSEDEVK